MLNLAYHNADLILEVSNSLGIADQGFIEKDLFVTHAVEIISQVESKEFKPIFAGGTCLAKAHQLIHRISENVDFKIAQKGATMVFSKETLRGALRNYYQNVLEALRQGGFGIDQNTVFMRNGHRYVQIQLHYPSLYIESATLRPHVLVEFTFSKPKLATQRLGIDSMVETYLKEYRSVQVECASVLETAAEKWVALARQVSAVERGIYKADRNIVRHLYDLYQINQQNALGFSFVDLVGQIIEQDGRQFGSQHPAFLANPLDEIALVLDVLKSLRYQQYYEDYVLRMLIGQNALQYQNAFENFERLAVLVSDRLQA